MGYKIMLPKHHLITVYPFAMSSVSRKQGKQLYPPMLLLSLAMRAMIMELPPLHIDPC